ncbi:MAG: prepilin-type N-terminal cleavage/methylation domain-containing protein, partial [Thermodesulfovibrionales bacterium]
MRDEIRKRRTLNKRILFFILHPSSFILRNASFILQKKGFTLLEVLIAVAILSIVLTALYGTFFLSSRAMEDMDESMTKLQESRKAIDILRRELESVYYNDNNEKTFVKILDKDLYGKQATQLEFTAFTTLRPGLSKISYYMEEKDRKRTLFKKIGSSFGKEESEGADIIEDLEEFTIEAKYQDKWVKTWDTGITKKMPDEIKISLSVMIKGRKV